MLAARPMTLADAVALVPDRPQRSRRRPEARRIPGADPRVCRTRAPSFRRGGVVDLVADPHPLLAAWWTAFLRIGRYHIDQALGRAEVDVRPWVLLAAGNWTFPDGARTNLLNGTFQIGVDTFKMALFLSTSNLGASTTTYAGVTNEVANANGYTTGGISATWALSGTTTVTADVTADPVWTASGGSITARFAALYEVSGSVVCYVLLDSTPADVTATTGNTLTVQIDVNGVFQLT